MKTGTKEVSIRLPSLIYNIYLSVEDNNIKLHENKFELVCYRTPASKSLSEELPFMSDITNYTTPNGSAIERSPLVRDLEVNMSDDYTWTPHINIMVGKARQMASWSIQRQDNTCYAPALQIPDKV